MFGGFPTIEVAYLAMNTLGLTMEVLTSEKSVSQNVGYDCLLLPRTARLSVKLSVRVPGISQCHTSLMHSLMVGYICPADGQGMRWESDIEKGK